jgi:hypothetical protein
LTRPVNFLTYSEIFITWFCMVVKVTALGLFLSSPANSQSTQAAIESARQSFAYITSTLNVFNSTGRLVNNPGIDGADLEAFIDVLDTYREQFSSSFNLDSAMCQFYLDSANARMSLEQKAEIAFSFLSDLTDRLDRFEGIDADFQETLESEFGSLILEQIKRQKLTVVSNQQLPTSGFGEAAVIAFIDSACS